MPLFMLRTKPSLKYCGLTLILSNPSRFDKLRLLSANGGTFFNNECLQPEFNLMQCDIRLSEDKSDFLPDTRCIILLGEKAMHEWLPETRSNTLNEMRGSPFNIKSIPALVTYLPQDCADIKDYERQYNSEAQNSQSERVKDDEEEDDVKTFSNTKRTNYSFWAISDVRKCKRLLSQGTNSWCIEHEPCYKIYPSAEEVLTVLNNTKGKFLYFDMETDYEETNLLCFSFSFDSDTVYSVPVLDFNYHPAYSSLSHIIKSLTAAIRDNTIVAHNGAAFDFFVLGYKYRIPIVKAYDTMLAMHRCFPEVEKSLGHCVSLWTNQKFHKDTDSQAYRTKEQMMAKLKYCAKDTFTMSLIHKAIEQYASKIPGLSDSINLANRSIRPYLTTMLQGIRYSEERVHRICRENDRLMEQYNRICEMLVGPIGIEHCRKSLKSKSPSMFASSSAQCVDYFHEQLGYPVIFRSAKTGRASLGKESIFQLALKHDNPVIKFIMLYRQLQKETGTLRFTPFRDDNNKIIDYKTYDTEQQTED